MKTRLLFVGQAPSRETEGQPVFSGKAGVLLASLMRMPQEEMLSTFDFINILDHFPGKSIVGDKFPILEAFIAAQKKLPQMANRPCILVGNNVARAFKLKYQYLHWYKMPDPDDASRTLIPLLAVIPHTSGLNRYYNSAQNRDLVSMFLLDIIERLRRENVKPAPGHR